jgi:hypothetical protein
MATKTVLRKVVPNTERHEFEMAPELLMNVIQQQAGTLGKAIYEGVMNAIDAMAIVCTITLTESKLVIHDNGGGMRNKEEILTRWKYFGQPQSAEEQERKSFGRYRMGRGQLFSFGKNTWRTNRFQLVTDIKHWGKKFEFTEGLRNSDGCTIEIELYDKLGMIEQADVKQEVTKLVRWASVNHGIRIEFNDKEIAKHPEDQPNGYWQYENDKLWLHITDGQTGLDVYHMGGYIKTFSKWEFGVSGELVSKVPMDVNFARNDIMVSKCAVWKAAKAFANEAAGKEIKKKSTLDDAARQRIVNQILGSELPWSEFKDAKIITDVCGRHWSLKQLRDIGYKFHKKITATEHGSLVGDKIQQAKLAFVLSKQTLERFRIKDAAELLDCCREWDPDFRPSDKWCRDHYYALTPVEFDVLEEGFETRHDIVDPKDWLPNEKLVVDICERLDHWFTKVLEVSDRRILVGISGSSDGWTNGSDYIALNRHWIETLDLGTVQDMVEIGSLLLHEYCHDDNDAETHTHTMEFYQRYHDAAPELAAFVHEAIGRLPSLCATLGRQLSRKQMREQDRIRKGMEAQDKVSKIAARDQPSIE